MTLRDLGTRIIRYRYFRALWSGLGRGNRKICIIPSRITTKNDPLTGFGEFEAASFIVEAIDTALGWQHIETVFPDLSTDRDKLTSPQFDQMLNRLFGDKDLILLGGPNVNPITKLAIERLAAKSPDDRWIADSHPLDDTEPYWVRYRGQPKRETRYTNPTSPHPDSMEADYGIFVVRPNCFSELPDTDARIALFYGAHTWGTAAAALMYFSFAGAAQIASRLKHRAGPWQLNVDGLIEVLPNLPEGATDEEKRHLLGLNYPERTIRILAPPHLQDSPIKNPARTDLKYLVRTAQLGSAHGYVGRFWLYAAYFVLAWAVATLSPHLAIWAALLWLSQKLVHPPMERLRPASGWTVGVSLASALFGFTLLHLTRDVARYALPILPITGLAVFAACCARLAVIFESEVAQLCLKKLKPLLFKIQQPLSVLTRPRRWRTMSQAMTEEETRIRVTENPLMDERSRPSTSQNTDAKTVRYALEEQVRKTVSDAEAAFRKCLDDPEWFRQHHGQWVAFHGHTILEFGDSQRQLLSKFSSSYDPNDLVVRRVRRQVLEYYFAP